MSHQDILPARVIITSNGLSRGKALLKQAMLKCEKWLRLQPPSRTSVHVRSTMDDAGVDIEYSGNPSAVIARLTSVDQSRDFAFDVPIKDPLAEVMRVGGSYPWRLDNGFST